MTLRVAFVVASTLLFSSLLAAQKRAVSAPALAIEVTKLADGFSFVEGPVWNPRGFTVFSDIPANTVYQVDLGGKTAVLRRPSGHANGNAYDLRGRLVSCEHDRRVSREKPDGSFETLADSFEGKKLNSPNDVAIFSDGSIFFTDPTYGIKAEESELGFRGLYRIGTDGHMELLDRDWQQPNGLCFSPDFKHLYVGDSQAGQIWKYDVDAKGALSHKILLDTIPKPGDPDGMKCDTRGNLYATGPGGVRVYSPQGVLKGLIAVPKDPANLCFGGRDGKTLFITARDTVYTAHPDF